MHCTLVARRPTHRLSFVLKAGGRAVGASIEPLPAMLPAARAPPNVLVVVFPAGASPEHPVVLPANDPVVTRLVPGLGGRACGWCGRRVRSQTAHNVAIPSCFRSSPALYAGGCSEARCHARSDDGGGRARRWSAALIVQLAMRRRFGRRERGLRCTRRRQQWLAA